MAGENPVQAQKGLVRRVQLKLRRAQGEGMRRTQDQRLFLAA
jgi:hypothetical protein